MGLKEMKLDIYTIKAIKAKGYDIEEIVKLSNEEIQDLKLPQTLTDLVIQYKQRGASSESELKEKIKDIAMGKPDDDEVPEMVEPEVIETYKTNSEEQDKNLEEVQQEFEDTNVVAEDEVQIERKESSADDITIIKEALQKKEYKSFQPYIKFLKTEVPEAILSAVDSTVLNELLEQRIAEVKEDAEKTK